MITKRLKNKAKLSSIVAASLVLVLSLSSCGVEDIVLSDEFVHEIHDGPERKKLRALAEKGNVEARYRLAQTYCCGIGDYYNNEKALNWYCQAALAGHQQAQFEVGMMYENAHTMRGWDSVTYRRIAATGAYPEKDVIKAYMWYSLADEQEGGHTHANARRADMAANHMTHDQVVAAQKMQETWRDIPCGTSMYKPHYDKMVY